MDKLNNLLINFSKMLDGEDCETIRINYWIGLEPHINNTSKQNELITEIIDSMFKYILTNTSNVIYCKNLFFCFTSFFLNSENIPLKNKFIVKFLQYLLHQLSTTNDYYPFFDYLLDFIFNLITSFSSEIITHKSLNNEDQALFSSISKNLLAKIFFSHENIFHNLLIKNLENLKFILNNDKGNNITLFWTVVIEQYFEKLVFDQEINKLNEFLQFIISTGLYEKTIEMISLSIRKLIYGNIDFNYYLAMSYIEVNKTNKTYNDLLLTFEKLINLVLIFLPYSTHKYTILLSIVESFLHLKLTSFNLFSLIYNGYTAESKELKVKEESKILLEKSLLYCLLNISEEIYNISSFVEYNIILTNISKILFSYNNVKISNVVILIVQIITSLFNQNSKYKYLPNDKLSIQTEVQELIKETKIINLTNERVINYNDDSNNIRQHRNISFLLFLDNFFNSFFLIEKNNTLTISISNLQHTIKYLSTINIGTINPSYQNSLVHYFFILINEVIMTSKILESENLKENKIKLAELIIIYIDNFLASELANDLNFTKKKLYPLIILILQNLIVNYSQYSTKLNNQTINDLIVKYFDILLLFSKDEKICLLITKLVSNLLNLKLPNSLMISNKIISLKIYADLVIKSKNLKLFANYFSFCNELLKKQPSLKVEIFNSFVYYYKNKQTGDSSDFENFIFDKFQQGVTFILQVKDLDVIVANGSFDYENENICNLSFSADILNNIYINSNPENNFEPIREKLNALFLNSDKFLGCIEKILHSVRSQICLDAYDSGNNNKKLGTIEVTFRNFVNLFSSINSGLLNDHKNLLKDSQRHTKREYIAIEKVCDYIVGNVLDVENAVHELPAKIALIILDEYLSYENNISFYLLNHSEDQALKHIEANNIDFASINSISKEYTKSKNDKFLTLIKGTKTYLSHFKESQKSIRNLLLFDQKFLSIEKKQENLERKILLPQKLYTDKIIVNIQSNTNSYMFLSLFLSSIFTNIECLNDNLPAFKFLLLEDTFFKKMTLLPNYLNFEIILLSFFSIVQEEQIKLDLSISTNHITNIDELFNYSDIHRQMVECIKLTENFISFICLFSRFSRVIFESSIRMLADNDIIKLLLYPDILSRRFFIDKIRLDNKNNTKININNELIKLITFIIKSITQYNSYKDNAQTIISSILVNISEQQDSLIFIKLGVGLLQFLKENKASEQIKPDFIILIDDLLNNLLNKKFNNLLIGKSLAYNNIDSLVEVIEISKELIANQFKFENFDSPILHVIDLKGSINFKNLYIVLGLILKGNNSFTAKTIEKLLLIYSIKSTNFLCTCTQVLMKDNNLSCYDKTKVNNFKLKLAISLIINRKYTSPIINYEIMDVITYILQDKSKPNLIEVDISKIFNKQLKDNIAELKNILMEEIMSVVFLGEEQTNELISIFSPLLSSIIN